jgi:glycosyltransferase involved in cell wall biosynthesis
MEAERSNAGQGLSLAGLIIGIIAIFIAVIPCIGMAAFIPGLLALIFSIVGLVQANQVNGKLGLPIVATVISGLSILIILFWFVLFAKVVEDPESLKDFIENVVDEETHYEIEKAIEEAKQEMENVEIHVETTESDEFQKDTRELEEKLKSLEDSSKTEDSKKD